MAKVPNGVEIWPKISIAWVGCTNVTDRQTDRQTDRRWHIANVNLSSRSLKIKHSQDFLQKKTLAFSRNFLHQPSWTMFLLHNTVGILGNQTVINAKVYNIHCSVNIPVLFQFRQLHAKHADNHHLLPTSQEIHLSVTKHIWQLSTKNVKW